MVIRPRAVAALILPVLAAPAAGWGFNADATQRLHTALMEAADQQAETGQAVDLEPLRQALAAGADPNALVPQHGERVSTPLAIAASLRDVGAIRLLLEQKAKVEVNDSRNGRNGISKYTALHCAIAPFVYLGEPSPGNAWEPCSRDSARPVPAVRALLEAGADLDAPDGMGRTPLMYAMLMGEPGVTRELLARGANPDLKNGQGKTAAELTPLYFRPRVPGTHAVFGELRRAAGTQEIRAIHHWHRRRPEALQAVTAGVTPGFPAPLAALITDYLFGGPSRAGAGAQSRTTLPLEHKGEAARAEAVDYPQLSELDASLLVAICRGFEVGNAKKNEHLLAEGRAAKEVERLLAEGADPNVRFYRGATPLMFLACASRPAPTLAGQLLGRKEIKLDLVDFDGSTALMLAARCGNTEVLKLLLAHGADPAPADRYGKTALQRAPADSPARQVLKDWVGQGRPQVALQAGAAPAAGSRLESKGDSQNQSDSGIPGGDAGKAAGAGAVTAGRDPRVEHKAAAPVESKDRPGAAAGTGAGGPSKVDADFALAFLMGLRDDQFQEAKRHLDAGANVNFAFPGGRTLLMLAADRATVPERLASLLLTHESLQVDLRDQEGRTALMVAARNGHAGLVETLLALGADPGLKDKDDDTALTLAAPDSKAHQALQAAGHR